MYILKSAEHIDLNSEDIIEAGVFPNLVILEDRVGLCIECQEDCLVEVTDVSSQGYEAIAFVSFVCFESLVYGV